MDFDRLKTVDIYSTAFGGTGVCRIDGMVCFVEGAFAGERALVEITEKKKNFLKAKALEILIPIPERIVSACPLAYSCSSKNLYCPGCAYQSLAYEKEIEFKDKQFAELLKKFAGITSEKKSSPLYAKEDLYYRNKIKLHHVPNSPSRFGFVSNDNKTIIEIPKCYLACHQINEELRNLGNRNLHSNEIVLRYTTNDGVRIFSPDKPRIKTEYLTQETSFGKFTVPVSSFFQVNIHTHEIMLREYVELLNKISPDMLLDLYCGIGIFGIIAAQKGIKSFGSDIDRDAIKAAEINAEQFKVKENIKFVSGDVSLCTRNLLTKNKASSKCVVLDPPRTGLEKTFTQMLCTLPIDDIIYISCSADTLCRDLKILIAAGYELEFTRIIDMFPRTKHFETITHLKNRREL